MNYRNIYIKIITNAKNEQNLGRRPRSRFEKSKFDDAYEFHHILPRSLFPNWQDRPTNIVALSLREHFFCHQLLTKIYPCPEMDYALFMLVNSKTGLILTSREFERIRSNSRSYIKRLWLTEEFRSKNIASRKVTYKNRTPEQIESLKKKHSLAQKNYRASLTPEEKENFAKKMSHAKLNICEERKKQISEKQSLAKKNMTLEEKTRWVNKKRETIANYSEEEKALHKRNRSISHIKQFQNLSDDRKNEINAKRKQTWKNHSDEFNSHFSSKCKERESKRNKILKPLYQECKNLQLVANINMFKHALKGIDIFSKSFDELITIVRNNTQNER